MDRMMETKDENEEKKEENNLNEDKENNWKIKLNLSKFEIIYSFF